MIPEIDTLFNDHIPAPDVREKFNAINSAAKALAAVILEKVPYEAERTASIRSLQEAVMWAKAAIVNRPPPP